eukprot:s1510_g2.t1
MPLALLKVQCTPSQSGCGLGRAQSRVQHRIHSGSHELVLAIVNTEKSDAVVQMFKAWEQVFTFAACRAPVTLWMVFIQIYTQEYDLLIRRTWSQTLNHWAFTDAVAAEMHAAKPLKFPPGGSLGPHGLSETAVIFKKSCFTNSTLARRLDALQECCDPESAKEARPVTAQPVTAQAVVAPAKEDLDLAKILKPAPARKFF